MDLESTQKNKTKSTGFNPLESPFKEKHLSMHGEPNCFCWMHKAVFVLVLYSLGRRLSKHCAMILASGWHRKQAGNISKWADQHHWVRSSGDPVEKSYRVSKRISSILSNRARRVRNDREPFTVKTGPDLVWSCHAGVKNRREPETLVPVASSLFITGARLPNALPSQFTRVSRCESIVKSTGRPTSGGGAPCLCAISWR